MRRPTALPRPLRWARIAALAAAAGFLRASAAPTTGPAAKTPPAVATDHTVAGGTVIGRTIDGGALVWETADDGLPVELLRADREWSRVRTADGRAGLVPTARLKPALQAGELADPRDAQPVGRWGGSPPPPGAGQQALAAPAARPPRAAAPAAAWPAVLFPKAPPAPPPSRRGDRPAGVVDSAIDKGVQFIYSRQGEDHWEVIGGPLPGVRGIRGAQWGELTALCTAALLAAGETPHDPRLSRAVAWLADARIVSPSVAGLRAGALSAAFDAADKTSTDLAARRASARLRAAMAGDARLLMTRLLDNAEHSKPAGLYPPEDGGAAASDLEVSQAATAGMAALDAADPGQGTFEDWHLVPRGWAAAQQPDGSWQTDPKAPPSARVGATAAAVATLVLARDRSDSPDSADCHGGWRDTNVDLGLQWLRRHHNDARGDLAATWAVQRMLLATGGRGAAELNRGAEDSIDYLIHHQAADGSWPAPAGADPDGRRLAETAYAVLTLAAWRTPVAMSRLDYAPPPGGKGQPDPAGERPRAAAHLVEWASGQIHRPLNWQWVRPGDLRDRAEAPVLYVAGSQALEFEDADLESLRAYVSRGGTILGNADCASRAFADSFVRLGTKLFPRYEFRPLPPEHALFTGQRFRASRWQKAPTILGLSDGARELMLLVPTADPSRGWQAGTHALQPPPFEVGFDLLSYARDPATLPWRGDPAAVNAAPSLRPATP